MIQGFSNFSKGWGAKIILGLLTLSMIVVWGLGGFLNTNVYGQKPAIEVGSDAVSMSELMNAFNAEKDRISRMMGGRYLSNKEALELGLLDQVIQQQIMERVQDQMFDELGLIASNEAVRKYVERHPAFADAVGNFDKNMFYAYLSQMQMNETMLAQKLQKELAAQHLANTIQELGYAPDLLTRLAYQYQNEKRDVEFAVIRPEDLIITEKPSTEKLREYYDAYADELMQPEIRTLSVVVLTPEMMMDRVVISDEEIDSVFAEKKAQFTIPEKRKLLQMRVDSEEKARELMQGLTASNFEQTAIQKVGQTKEQTNFGEATKAGVLEELAEPIFTAKKGSIVGPIESSLGWHIFLVQDITPAVVPDDKEIRADIKKQLANDKVYDAMYELSRQLEDILGAGDSLEWAVKELKLPVQKITTDVSGKDANGKELPADLKNVMLLQEAFSLDKGGVSSLVENGAGYILAQVDDITPAHQKPFDTVQKELLSLWTKEQQNEKINEVVESILKRVQAGNSLQAQGVFGHFKVQNAKGVTRVKFNSLPRDVVNSVFQQKSGTKNAALWPTQGGFVVAVVKKIQSADPGEDKVGLGAMAQNIKILTGDTMTQSVLASYANQFGVKVNEKEITQAFSGFTKEEE